jgi:hypothetical protein
MKKVVFGSVSIKQTGFDKFTVTYGLQVKKGLNYAQAAAEFGECVMHEACCEGKLDNRTKREAAEQGDSKPYFEGA